MSDQEQGTRTVQFLQVRLGRGNDLAVLGVEEGWVGTGWLGSEDLSGRFPENWRSFNAEFVEKLIQGGATSKVAAGLACAATWNVGFGLKTGDIVITPDTEGILHFGEITGDYFYEPGKSLPHRRPVSWYPTTISRGEISETLRHSLGSVQTIANVSSHADEIRSIIGHRQIEFSVEDETVESPMAFALEKHLEDFLLSNWENTEFGRFLNIYEVDGEQVGRQFPTDTGNIDILAQSKDGKELVVIELKRGRVSDVVVGQLLRYMGYVADLDPDQTVKGIIVGTDDDQRFKRALSMVPNAEFYKYEVTFALRKA
jgi:restriction system protein